VPTTKEQLSLKVKEINRVLKRFGYNVRLVLIYKGKPRQPAVYLFNMETFKTYMRLSPRAKRGVLMSWLEAFHRGLNLGLLKGEQK